MTVVSDSSPLIALALIDHIELLRILYGRVHIASATRSEVVEKGKGRAGAALISKADWIVVNQVSRKILSSLRTHPAGLHRGEIEAIGLALQLDADLLLVDERQARKFANKKGIRVFGTLGVLKLAHQRGLVADLRLALHELRANGFYVGDELYQEILGN